MIDIKTRKNILSQLAKDDGDVILNSLEKEARKIEKILNEVTDFKTIEDYIDLLDAFAYRIPEKAFSILDSLLHRLETLQVTHEPFSMISEDMVSRLYSKSKLVNACLNCYRHICYFDIKKILMVFLKYSSNEDSNIRRQAIEGINEIAGYNLEVYKERGLYYHQEIIDRIESLLNEEKVKYFNGLITACTNLLYPELKLTTFSYPDITFTTASHTANYILEDIRQRSIIFLENLYKLVVNIEDKKVILGTLQNACRTPHRAKYDNEFYQIIRQNTEYILGISEKIVDTEEDLQLVQVIEEDAYWLYRHFTEQTVRNATCKVKAILDTKYEYQVFKVLIGFRGVFNSWCNEENDPKIGDINVENEFQSENQNRENRLQELINDVRPENYEQWEKRIIAWSQIQSNDMATFPYFSRFLENIGKNLPDFTLSLIREHDEHLDRFMVPIIIGILQSNKKDEFQTFTKSWLAQEKHLQVMANVCEYADYFDQNLLIEVAEIAINLQDRRTLYECLSALFCKLEQYANTVFNTLLQRILEVLTEYQDSYWIQNFWYRDNLKTIIQTMEDKTIDAVLSNLTYLDRIDYMGEYILAAIAECNPTKILNFFGKRIKSISQKEHKRDYEPVPFSFDQLRSPLAKIHEQTIRIIRQWCIDDRSRLFCHLCGKLISNIFPEFEENLKNEILNLIQEGGEEDYQFILEILKNYHENHNIYDVITELIKRLPEGRRELNEIMMILQSTGVVTGEYGFVEAYKRKKKEIEIEFWLENDDSKIRAFAEDYIAMLDRMIDSEEIRAKERIILMKHQYRE